MKLRPYQERAVQAARAAILNRPILVLPTGAGKTVVAGHIINLTELRVLFLVHRRELVQQAKERFAAFGIRAGIIQSGHDPNPFARVQIASIQTLARRRLPPAGLVIIDECHHASSESWARILSEYPNSFRLGLTATPYRPRW